MFLCVPNGGAFFQTGVRRRNHKLGSTKQIVPEISGTNVYHEFLVQIAWLSRVYASSSAPQSERNPKKFEVKIGDTRSSMVPEGVSDDQGRV